MTTDYKIASTFVVKDSLTPTLEKAIGVALKLNEQMAAITKNLMKMGRVFDKTATSATNFSEKSGRAFSEFTSGAAKAQAAAERINRELATMASRASGGWQFGKGGFSGSTASARGNPFRGGFAPPLALAGGAGMPPNGAVQVYQGAPFQGRPMIDIGGSSTTGGKFVAPALAEGGGGGTGAGGAGGNGGGAGANSPMNAAAYS